ncbi:MAG: cytochrome c family protein [Proteobacteria bacterium]|nr:cytochrome c family protein [Pseudomonadota bacterium]MBU1737827.1 cytochrome c family protein [Pseudomonadota bacterium]
MTHDHQRKIILILLTLLIFSGPFAACLAETGPETVELASLGNFYDAVIFNHSMHVDLAEGKCAKCHHHTTGTAPENPKCLRCHKGGHESGSMACQECHPAKRFEAAYLSEVASNTQLYHIDKPGLKGAYHQNCLGCHQETGGPTGCQDCHARNKKGDEIFHSGEFAPISKADAAGH